MRRAKRASWLKRFGYGTVVVTALGALTGVAHAQIEIYIGPGGIGFSYEDNNVGVIIGDSPSSRRSEDRRYHESARDDRYEYVEPQIESFDSVRDAVVEASGDAAEYQAMAEDAFRTGDYLAAARWSRHAIVEQPRNGGLHLFAGLILFATGDYGRSASAVQRGMSLSSRESWGVVVKNYTRLYQGDQYVNQMKRLNNFIKETPGAPYAYFLRGYHYGYLGHETAAQKDLAKAIKLESRDELSSELLVAMGGQSPVKSAKVAPRSSGVPSASANSSPLPERSP